MSHECMAEPRGPSPRPEGGRRDGLLGVLCHTYFTCYTTHKQHDVYVCVGLCVCRSVTPNSGVKSEKHFHLELIHSTANAKDLCLSVDCSLYCVINGVLLSTKRINFHSAAKERSPH